MVDQSGARQNEALRQHPSDKSVKYVPFPLKGEIQAVYYADTEGNPTKETVVDIQPRGGYPLLKKVPLCTGKINKTTGEEWTPDPGDGVIIQFIDGNWRDPIVTGYFRLPGNEIQAGKADAPSGKRRYHRRINKTDLVIDKDGNRTEHVEGNETVTIKDNETVTIGGNETITINGHETVTVQTGDVTVDVVEGKCTVHIKGKTVWQSEATVEIDGTSTGAVKGIVQGDCICPYTRKPHVMISASVKGSK